MPDTASSAYADHEEIRRVRVRFARALDEKDWDGHAALYAEDGRLSTPRGEHRGRAGLARFVAADLARHSASHHVSASVDITLVGDSAQVRSSLQATHVRGEPTDFRVVGGWYDTTLRRTGETWAIASVRINRVWRYDTRDVRPAPPMLSLRPCR